MFSRWRLVHCVQVARCLRTALGSKIGSLEVEVCPLVAEACISVLPKVLVVFSCQYLWLDDKVVEHRRD